MKPQPTLNFSQVAEILGNPKNFSFYMIEEQMDKKSLRALQRDVENWDESSFIGAQSLAKSRWLVEAPLSFFRDCAINNLSLAFEIDRGTLDDTYARELLADCISQKCGLKQWPKIYEGDEFFANFKVKLNEKLQEFGGAYLDNNLEKIQSKGAKP